MRRERSRDVMLEALGSHSIPDHVHQMGSGKSGLEKTGVGSQLWKLERGSLREDLRESREMSSRGREAESTETGNGEINNEEKENVKK